VAAGRRPGWAACGVRGGGGARRPAGVGGGGLRPFRAPPFQSRPQTGGGRRELNLVLFLERDGQTDREFGHTAISSF
jgi:hypothetical protein